MKKVLVLSLMILLINCSKKTVDPTTDPTTDPNTVYKNELLIYKQKKNGNIYINAANANTGVEIWSTMVSSS